MNRTIKTKTVRKASGPVRTEYTREELIAICDRGVVPQDRWHDRDSAKAQRQLAEAGALLKAGCAFRILTTGRCATTDRTIWIDISSQGFSYFEMGSMDTDTFYLPTPERLAERDGGDWY